MLQKKIIAYLKLMRFHQPIGIWLLLFPALWALWIAGEGRPCIENTLVIILGSVTMRAAGCVINDVADRNFDKHVKRTRLRPVTSGEISVKNAMILFFILIIFAASLLFFLNFLCFQLACLALFLACLYPFTKRWVSVPQFFLSLAFGMGIPIAFASQVNHLNIVTLYLYLINMLWVLMYDTEYAMSDREDDLKINIKSTAILWGKNDIAIVISFQVTMIILLILLGWILKLSPVYYLFILISVMLFLYQIKLISKRNPQNCLKAFRNNQWVGLAIFLGIFISLNISTSTTAFTGMV